MKRIVNSKVFKIVLIFLMTVAILLGSYNIKVSAKRIVNNDVDSLSDVYSDAAKLESNNETENEVKEENTEESIANVESAEAKSESYTNKVEEENNSNNNDNNYEETVEESHNTDQGVAIVSSEEEYEEPKSNSQSMYINGAYYDVEARFNYPKLGISYPVLSEWSDSLLRISLCHYWGFGPNQTGNYCIVGHNYSNGSLFGKLSGADIGDTFTLTTMDGNSLTYTVYDIYVVEPTDLSCTSQRTNGNTEITLITCYNNGAQRLIIKARA